MGLNPAPDPMAEKRAYAQWYSWALPNVGGDDQRAHSAAGAAVAVLNGGGDSAAAVAAARSASESAAPPIGLDQALRDKRIYAQAFAGVVAKGVPPEQAHQAVEAALARGDVRVTTKVVRRGASGRRALAVGAGAVGIVTLLSGLLGGLITLGGYAIGLRIWRSQLETWLKVVLISASVVVGLGLYLVGVTVLAYLTGR